MKKLILLFIFASVPLLSQFSGGSGVEGDPYLISCRDDLEALADSVKSFYADFTGTDFSAPNFKQYGKHFLVIKDITDSVRTVIGEVHISTFNGVFDGGGHKITLAIDSFISTTGWDCRALFGWVTGNAVIKNVIVDGYVRAKYFASGIVNNIDNSENNYQCKIMNCINMANIGSGGRVAGIVSCCSRNVVIENCVNLGTIEAVDRTCGGIVALKSDNVSENMWVKNCINAGFLYETRGGDWDFEEEFFNSGFGGIVGCNVYKNEKAAVINSINTGIVKPGPNRTGYGIMRDNNGE